MSEREIFSRKLRKRRLLLSSVTLNERERSAEAQSEESATRQEHHRQPSVLVKLWLFKLYSLPRNG